MSVILDNMQLYSRVKTEKEIQAVSKRYPIVLLSGLFGVGKSTLLASLARSSREAKPPVRILHLDAEDYPDAASLLEATRALGVGPSALFLDNADRCSGLSGALASIRSRYSASILLASRGGMALESALRESFGPSFSRDFTVYRLQPLGYGEFIEATGLKESRKTLDLYCKTGGLPQSLMIDPESADAAEFTRIRANSFILTEIVEPNSIRNPSYLRELLSLIARFTGERMSARQASEAMAAKGITFSPQSVLDYLGFCARSSLLVPVPLLDIDKNRELDGADSWYFGDAGLRFAFSARETRSELSRAEENLLFLRLADDGWTVKKGRVGYGKHATEEIGFVCERNGTRSYAQIVPGSATAGERMRSYEALLAIRDAWPRYLLDAGADETARDGIRRLSVRDALLRGLE